MYKLAPALHSAIWGGERLKDVYGCYSMDNIAEAWVLSCHEKGYSLISGGEFDGDRFADHVTKEMLGSDCADIDAFPVLIKFIDAKDKLSIQVHPDDEYALAHTDEKNGKTEAWYILGAEENAELIYGFDREVTKEEFRGAIDDGTLSELCRHVPVKPGDVAFIPARTLHGIGAGTFLIEVQQSSNTTYRAYDYKRLQSDGTLRELHEDDSVEVADRAPRAVGFAPEGEIVKCGDSEKQYLCGCDYFSMTSVKCRGSYEDTADERSFVSLVFLGGEAEVRCGGESLPVKKGDSIFIAAGEGAFSVEGSAELLMTRV